MEETPLGNAGALYKLKDKLTEDFLLLNADSIFDVDFNRFVDYHKAKGGLVTLFTHPNSHPYDSDLIIADKNGSVEKWLAKEDERPQWYRNRVNAGLHVISPKVLETEITTPKIDLDRQLLKPLAGTINKYVGFLRDIDDFELIEGVADAIKKINASGYLAIVVTNQPVVARGEISFEELEQIHNKMETLLGAEGAYLDAIYFCPHHPHKGYEGERPELKFDCDCRKSKLGMLLKVAEDFNIDLSQSWMVGDGENDIKAGMAAECHTALIGAEDFGQEMTVNGLLELAGKL